ncbi:SDR family NAD(P)-dependent oxidoreductase [Celeribacter halophilus]|uniref:SDR family NAD(P)-dependent oxidoreductase n=1 Tax=Celeribacter halophilus TaxID=576117 RepID=UPI001C0817E3|nr:SDR family NAD(P)-dependent oxidoreductase [Celeribacter halophilus]MBU2889332.1 SDR family oxidoreductase [Celeribacter halophilus]MDO6509430.1 SDR family NAD(P)-dependent oxidoreductase [Celeribacter halophilus]
MTENTKIALITGASRGLGFFLAEALAPAYHIVAVAKTTGALEELDDRIQAKGGQATLAPMDVTNPDAMAHLCRGIYDRWRHVDLWAHTAVYAQLLSPADHMDPKDFDRTILTNVTATGKLIPMIAPLLNMAPAPADVLFFDDPHAGEKFFGAYGASKAAQIAMAKSWQAETQPVEKAPRVHILSPRPMPTATRARFFPGEDKSTLAHPRDEAPRLLKEAGIL